jgi:phthalate 4,5-dioxygenase oxygenase subunit
MNTEQNELLTRITPGTPCGKLLRQYWQPAALVDEFNPALDPRMEIRPVKALKLFGQDLVLFKDASGAWGLLDRDCAHRGADLSFGRRESAAPGRRPALPFPRLEVRHRRPLPGNTGRAHRQQAVRAHTPAQLPGR